MNNIEKLESQVNRLDEECTNIFEDMCDEIDVLYYIQKQLALANKIELEKIRRQSNIAPKANLEWSKPISTTQIT